MKRTRSATFGLTMLMAVSPAIAETPSIRLTAPVWMLSADNPLRRERPPGAAVEVELPGRLHSPPLEVPERPRSGSLVGDRVEVAEILAALRPQLGIADPVLINAEAYYRDYILVLAFVRSAVPEWRVFALTNRPGEGWQASREALSDSTVEAVAAGWGENGWIEVIPGNVVASRN